MHGLCDHQSVSEFNKVTPEGSSSEAATPDMKKMNTSRNSPVLTTKKIKRTHTPKPVTATISPAFPPLRPSSRNSPKPGPSNRTTESPIAVKVEETNFSDEENHPEHIVIPSDPNTIGGKHFKLNYFSISTYHIVIGRKINYSVRDVRIFARVHPPRQ